MPQTAQEKAIHANSKSNGNSNEVTFASMVKDDEPVTNNGTTNEKKQSWISGLRNNYATKKVSSFRETKKAKQENNKIMQDEFMKKFKEIRNNDKLDTKQKLEKFDDLHSEYLVHDKTEFTQDQNAQIRDWVLRTREKAGNEKITTTQELNQEKEIKEKKEKETKGNSPEQEKTNLDQFNNLMDKKEKETKENKTEKKKS